MFNKCMGCGNYGGTSLLCAFACERYNEMKNEKIDHCKKADCIYYDHENFSNHCSASSTQHKGKNECQLYTKKEEDDYKRACQVIGKECPYSFEKRCITCPVITTPSTGQPNIK